jgi:hypothetical protein
MSDLLELAARCEKATGPDRELDQTIARCVNWCPSNVNPEAWARNEDLKPRLWFSDAFGMPAYTASLDAAMTLVTEGHKLLLAQNLKDDRWHATVSHLDKSWFHCTREAATPALALCAAALRARAA